MLLPGIIILFPNYDYDCGYVNDEENWEVTLVEGCYGGRGLSPVDVPAFDRSDGIA